MIQPVYHTLSVLSSALWAQFNHRVPCALPGLSTDSAERRGSSCGHVHCRRHSGRWPTLCCFLLHIQASLKGKAYKYGWYKLIYIYWKHIKIKKH